MWFSQTVFFLLNGRVSVRGCKSEGKNVPGVQVFPNDTNAFSERNLKSKGQLISRCLFECHRLEKMAPK